MFAITFTQFITLKSFPLVSIDFEIYGLTSFKRGMKKKHQRTKYLLKFLDTLAGLHSDLSSCKNQLPHGDICASPNVLNCKISHALCQRRRISPCISTSVANCLRPVDCTICVQLTNMVWIHSHDSRMLHK